MYVLLHVSVCSETLRDEMAELPAVLVGVLVPGTTDGDRGLRLKDASGEIPCEVSYVHDTPKGPWYTFVFNSLCTQICLPVEEMNSIVLLKEWNVICSSK